MCWGPSQSPGGRRLVVANATQEIHDERENSPVSPVPSPVFVATRGAHAPILLQHYAVQITRKHSRLRRKQEWCIATASNAAGGGG